MFNRLNNVRKKSRRSNRREKRGSKRNTKGRSKKSEEVQWLNEKREKFKRLETVEVDHLRLAFSKFLTELSFKVSQKLGSSGKRRLEVNKAQFLAMCRELMGDDIDSSLVMKLFDYMDCDKNGKVDEVEFSIVSVFLLSKNVVDTNNLELAFNLFDSNKDGGISQQEFSEMLAVVAGNSVEELISISIFRPVFDNFATNNCMEESLSCFYALLPYFGQDSKTKQITLQKAEKIYETFIENGSEQEINIAAVLRSDVSASIAAARKAKTPVLDTKIFKECFNEVSYLLKTNALPQFKKYLRNSPFSEITLELWEKIGKSKDELLTFKEFSDWVQAVPNLFDNLQKIQREFSELIESFYASKL